MEVTIKFNDEQEADAKDFINAMDENRELLVKYSRIENFIDDLVTAVEHNRGVYSSGDGSHVPVAGVEVPSLVDSEAIPYTLVNAIVNQLEQILEV